jgi:hypothetical protein
LQPGGVAFQIPSVKPFEILKYVECMFFRKQVQVRETTHIISKIHAVHSSNWIWYRNFKLRSFQIKWITCHETGKSIYLSSRSVVNTAKWITAPQRNSIVEW